MSSPRRDHSIPGIISISVLASLLISGLSAGVGPGARAQADQAATQACSGPASARAIQLDGVDLTLCVPFIPDTVLSAADTDIVQSAAAVRRTPHSALLLYAVPYGLVPAGDGLPAARPGVAQTYQDISSRAYAGEALEALDGPSISILGQTVAGRTVIIPNKIGGPAVGQQMITQWVVEAGERVWIVQLIWTADSFADKAAAFGLLQSTSVRSPNVNRPSTSLRLSQQPVPPVKPQPPATATDLPFPSWWSGDCDANNFPGSYPLGASYRGVKACGPRSTMHLVHFAPNLVGQYEWQCVELVMRYMYLAFGIEPYGGNGKNVVWYYPGSRLQKVVNGTPHKGPIPGDVVSYNGDPPFGHTALVSAANIDAGGNGFITIVEQNYYDGNGSRTEEVANWYILSNDDATGWLHDAQAEADAHFAVIGDYGIAGPAESAVAALVESWQPDFIVTVGDNNYPSGAMATIDTNIGQYYHDFIYPYVGTFGSGAAVNAFFPVPGNHDWIDGPPPSLQPYLDYFTLPMNPSGNERYYDFVRGSVHFFMLDSDPYEPDGYTETSTQALWLQNALAASASPWNIVLLHHAPYSSGSVHGSTPELQWPYQAWGADAVLAGHEHTYERIIRNSFPYFVNGLGGAARYGFNQPFVDGSLSRYSADNGAMLVDAGPSSMFFQFISTSGTVQDSYELPFVTISGNVGAAGASLSYSDGTTNTVTADSEGNYTLRVSHGWSGSVTPSMSDYKFTPDHTDYSALTVDQPSQNYTATLVTPKVLQLAPADGAEACLHPQVGVNLLLTDLVRSNGSYDPSTITLTLDGIDVTGLASILQTETYPASHASILYTPTDALAVGPHQAVLTYASSTGLPPMVWNFTAADIVCPTGGTRTPALEGEPHLDLRGVDNP